MSIDDAVTGLSMAGMKGAFKPGFFKEMTCWMILRTNVP